MQCLRRHETDEGAHWRHHHATCGRIRQRSSCRLPTDAVAGGKDKAWIGGNSDYWNLMTPKPRRHGSLVASTDPVQALQTLATAVAKSVCLVVLSSLYACSALNEDYNPTRKHHRTDGFQNNYTEATDKSLMELLRWQFARKRDGLPKPPQELTRVIARERRRADGIGEIDHADAAVDDREHHRDERDALGAADPTADTETEKCAIDCVRVPARGRFHSRAGARELQELLDRDQRAAPVLQVSYAIAGECELGCCGSASQ